MHQLRQPGCGRSVAIVVVLVLLPAAFYNYDRLLSDSWPIQGWMGATPDAELKHNFTTEELGELHRVLKSTAFRNKTIIITTLNSAWAAQDSMFELFLSSFKLGNGTHDLLNHLLVVALDETALNRCRDLHAHCFMLKTDGVDFRNEKYFMSSDYLKMMWRRIDFLRFVLELGYNFVFSDADILWLQDPFEHFSPASDFEIACDHFNGNPHDTKNEPNGGFVRANSNPRTIRFYRFWYQSRLSYPGLHDQHVLDKIKVTSEFKTMKARFLSTQQFANFCEISKSRPGTTCTMHANCCKGLNRKLEDLRRIIKDWSSFKSLDAEKGHRKQWSSLKCPKRKHRLAIGF